MESFGGSAYSLAIALGALGSAVIAGEKFKDVIPTTYYDGSTDPDPSFSNDSVEKLPTQAPELGPTNNCACDDACGCGNGCTGNYCCCCGRTRPMWVGGVDALFLGANMTKGSARTTIEGESVIGNGVCTFTYARAVWLGYQGPCWGLSGRMFYLNASEQRYDPLLATGDTIGFTLTDTLRVYTTDLEAVRRLGPECWSLYASFGVRHAGFRANSSIWQSGIFVDTPQDDTTVASAQAATNRAFNGAGLTSGVWGEIPVTPCSCLSYVWGWRTSLLWGNTNAGAIAHTVGNSAASAGSIDSAFASTRRTCSSES